MGVDSNGLQFLLSAKKAGVSFRSTMMIGRQNFNYLSRSDISKALTDHNLSDRSAEILELFFIEKLLRLLGAELIELIDASAFEGATITHDLNLPIPECTKNKFSAVLEFGTLEHVFNFPQAMKNVMELVAPDGHLLMMTPTNNQMGHGFYQFSPELLFRVLSQENGFKIEEMYLSEERKGSSWYRVSDPAISGRRVGYVNGRPACLMVKAKRTQIVEIFKQSPQQSDYSEKWKQVSKGTVRHHGLKALLPEAVKQKLRKARSIWWRINNRPDPTLFERVR